MANLEGKDILDGAQFARPELEHIIKVAAEMRSRLAEKKKLDLMEGYVMGALFFEPSTRTRLSFETAMHRLGGDVVGFSSAGGLTVWPTTQSIRNVRILLGEIFGIPLSKVNVKRIPVGGTFGSSIQMNPPIPICAALALKAGRPVKLTLTREEDVHDHTRYGTRIRLKMGARKDGTLTGAEMELLADIGAHNIQAYSFLGVCAGWLVSLYKFPSLRYRGTAVYTNKAPSCAMQGFGNPQVTFAVESLIEELALKLGIDSLELRLRNYVGLGDSFWGQGPLVRSIVQSDGVPELIREAVEMIGWNDRAGAGSQTGRHQRGIGMARGFHTSGAGAPQPGDVIDFSGAMVKVNRIARSLIKSWRCARVLPAR